jgi:choline-sulfatase
VPGHEGRETEAGALGDRKTVPTGAGTTLEIEVDDEAEQAAIDYLKQRAASDQPFALCVGFIAPHFPFVVPEPYFSDYWPENADLPDIPEGHLDKLPVAAQRLRRAFGFWGHTEDQVRRARAAYYGLITYLDRKIGNLLDALEKAGLAKNTVVVYTSDHGEMLGEHGLWRKMCFYEEAARIPLQIRCPSLFPAGKRVSQCVSLVDLTATVLDLAGISPEDQKGRWQVDGDSLLPLFRKGERGNEGTWKDEAFAEHNAHGTDRPRAMLRSDKWKLCCGYGRPLELELYDLASDPGEFHNLAEDSRFHSERNALMGRLFQLWDGAEVDRRVRRSQQERAVIRSAAPEEGLL